MRVDQGIICTVQGQRIAIIGIGAIGGAIGADLLDLGRHQVRLCARTGFDQLVVRHPAGESAFEARLPEKPSDVGVVDWVLLATKAHQCASAEPWLRSLSGPETPVAVLQNGVDHVDRVSPLVDGGTEILPVVVQLPAEKKSPGRVVQEHAGALIVADDTLGLGFAELFEGARTNVVTTSKFTTQTWWKLIMNAAVGGVCALAIRENGIVKDPSVRELVISLMREVTLVGCAEGADLPDDAPEKALDVVLSGATEHWASISVDRREGRPMEWEARNAVVGRLGRKHGIETPMNDAITTLLKAADAQSVAAGR